MNKAWFLFDLDHLFKFVSRFKNRIEGLNYPKVRNKFIHFNHKGCPIKNRSRKKRNIFVTVKAIWSRCGLVQMLPTRPHIEQACRIAVAAMLRNTAVFPHFGTQRIQQQQSSRVESADGSFAASYICQSHLTIKWKNCNFSHIFFCSIFLFFNP